MVFSFIFFMCFAVAKGDPFTPNPEPPDFAVECCKNSIVNIPDPCLDYCRKPKNDWENWNQMEKECADHFDKIGICRDDIKYTIETQITVRNLTNANKTRQYLTELFRNIEPNLPGYVNKPYIEITINESLENIRMKFFVIDRHKKGFEERWSNTSDIIDTMNYALDSWVGDGIFDPILGIKVTNASMMVVKPYSECIDENKFSCVVGGKYVCLENNPRCDGKEECDDKSDERDCRVQFTYDQKCCKQSGIPDKCMGLCIDPQFQARKLPPNICEEHIYKLSDCLMPVPGSTEKLSTQPNISTTNESSSSFLVTDECKSCIISPEGKCSVQSPTNSCEFCHCLEGKLYPDQCFNCREMKDPERRCIECGPTITVTATTTPTTKSTTKTTEPNDVQTHKHGTSKYDKTTKDDTSTDITDMEGNPFLVPEKRPKRPTSLKSGSNVSSSHEKLILLTLTFMIFLSLNNFEQ